MSRAVKLRQMLAKDPADVFLNFGLAMELVKEGKSQEALSQFDRVLSFDPAYTAAHYQKAQVLIALGHSSEAREVLTHGVDAARAAGDAHTEREMRGLLESIT